MDLSTICADMSVRYPQWKQDIAVLELREDPSAAPVENDGRVIRYSDRALRGRPPEEQLFWFSQQLLHIRLAHAARGAGRDPALWRQASDAVVNAMLLADGFELPDGVPFLPPEELCSAETLYGMLLGAENKEKKETADDDAKEKSAVEERSQPRPSLQDRLAQAAKGPQQREIQYPGLAEAIAGLRDLLEPSLQLEFDWFPGDTIRDGMLRERFKPYPIPHAEILLDTSASVDAELLRAFVRGVKSLLQEDAVVRVGCFDTQFYGFQEVRSEKDIQELALRGGGGTNFEVAIHAFTGDAETRIIFTDGYAEMPEERCDAIWLIYSDMPVHPQGGTVIYVKKPEEKERDEIDFLIT